MKEIFFNMVTIPRIDYNNDIYLNRRFFFEKNQYNCSELPEIEKEIIILSNHWALCKVICISGKIANGDNIQDFKMCSENEPNLIKAFVDEIINKNTSSTWIHYGGLAFDVPLIIKRAIKYGSLISNNEFKNLTKFRIHPHYDCSAILGNWGPESTVSFESACKEFDVDFDFDSKEYFSTVSSQLKLKTIKELLIKDFILDHSLKKTKALYELYHKMRKNI